MSTPADTTDSITAIADMINGAGLGPARVDLVTVGDLDVIRVEVDAASPRKATILLRWLDFLDSVDAIAGKYHDNDTLLRLTIRGMTPSDIPMMVIAPYSERTETAAAAVIADGIERQDIPGLLARLAALEVTA